MAGSSPSRGQGYHWGTTSPQRTVLEEILGDDRNSEARHRMLLEAAKREHERVRKEAERVYWEHLKREEQQRLLEARRKEEERIRLEEQLAADRARLNELKAKKIEIPPPLPEPEPPAASAVNGKLSPPAQSDNNNGPAQSTVATAQHVPVTRPPAAPIQASAPSQPPATVLNKAPEPQKPVNSVPGVNGLSKSTLPAANAPSNAETARPAAPQPTQAGPDRYTEIHQNLKKLRKFMIDQAKTNPALKGRMGDMRREIRKSVGQLTVTQGVAGVNKVQVK